MEIKSGGVWRYVMHGPDGRDYQNLITYLEVVEPERLTYKHGGDVECEPVNFQTTVTFEKVGEHGNQTRLTLRSIFPSKNARDFVIREYNAVEGGKQTLARLGEYLDLLREGNSVSTRASPRQLVITRVFKAPRERVFDLWTQREHLMRWFGPKGFTIPSCTLDLRPGGAFHYAMQPPAGPIMWAKWTFREIAPPERLVFVVSFTDDAGKVIRAPFDQTWPLEMLATVTFAHHAGVGRGTVVTLNWVSINATEAEHRVFDAGHESMQQGWSGTFDKLDDYVYRG
jgi:uncharacterized protein YndB with AHSA1/START domain